jgi:hypothetical protein
MYSSDSNDFFPTATLSAPSSEDYPFLPALLPKQPSKQISLHSSSDTSDLDDSSPVSFMLFE